MQIIQQITREWKQWIDENLARGCSVDSMVESMIAAGVGPEVARQWLAIAKMPAGSADRPNSAGQTLTGLGLGVYSYETPRIPTAGSVIKTHDRDVRVALRMAQPVVAIFDGVLGAEECDELIRLSRIKLQRSTIVDPQTGVHTVIEDRSSYGTFFALNETAFIAQLDRRIAEVMHMPIENGEGLQILNYQVGGEYKTHFDYFPPADPGSAAHIAKGGQRVSTLVIYLNDVECGGETIFPNVHMSVVPKKGSAVYFEYCNSLGQVDPKSLHGGTPVVLGEKWIATKWMRQTRYG
jgi:prolyl 4-hydroxylase